VRRIAAVLTVLAMSLALHAPAAAQIGPLPPAPTPPTPAPTTPADEGLSTLQQLLIFGGAGALIGVIAWIILRDARRAAPRAQRSQSDPGKPAGKQSARERERERRRRRGKARAAKQQRKRNRSR